MTASLVYNETTNIVSQGLLLDPCHVVSNFQIPSSPAYGECRKQPRQQAVEEHLSPVLKSRSKLRYIGEDHECFALDSVVAFLEEYGIKLDGNPWKNFKRLLCGYRDLPFIVLQNPTRKHVFDYEEMKTCPTLQWIIDVLGEIGLTLEDVVILDICSLLSDDDLDEMGRDSQRTWDAVEKSYAMVEDILGCLNPSVIISCQCVTLGKRERKGVNQRLETTWPPAVNGLARNLCSAERDTKRGATKKIQIGSNSTLCVSGVHPRRCKFQKSMVPELRGVFKDVFVPCMAWFGNDRLERVVPITNGERRLGPGAALIRTKARSPSPKRSIEVNVKEVDKDVGELGERLSTLELSRSDRIPAEIL
ncbi:hypothetical protein N8I77_009764 [Diaporthe amygdali]|uniref:Uncharacterized protein n=1 Tax=Phomopsis amygdali TaxID=1214568 RepID=A0AAD9SAI4_PHOAM|nr:hypothetical protein N8I77_009764 [Diaporthe amygdali]